MGGKNVTVSTSEPLLGTLRVQTSMYGLAVPLVWGQARIPGNLLWFGNFVATAHTTTTTQGGKGGGGYTSVDTKYTYTAAAIMALARGVIYGIASAWVGKKRYSGHIVPERVVGRATTATLPGSAPLTVTVSLSGGTFEGTASVTVLGTADHGEGAQEPYNYGLPEGQTWTRSGLTYTFDVDYPGPGREVTINWLERMPEEAYSALEELGLSFAMGLTGQPVWPWLSSYKPAEALAYSGMAYVYANDYPLTTQAEVENHNFEVIAGHQVGGGVVDADPTDVLLDFLTSPLYGAGWKPGRLSDMATYQSYVRARQLWLSPSMLEQRPAREWLEGLAEITNSEWVWQGGQLDLRPRGDEAITSAHGTYTPVTTPVFDLVHAEGGDILEAVEIEPVINEDAKNIVRIEWTNRANDYSIEVMEARDAAHIEVFGERPGDVKKMHAIHLPAVAQGVVQQLLQREMTVWNKYRFKVPFSRALMGLMDLVTLTDDDSALDRVPVRIIGRGESSSSLAYEYEAEDAPIGSASAPLYGQQAGAGFAHDYNAIPGNVTAPVFFEAAIERTVNGLEVYAAFSGTQEFWGGARVWASLDGETYKDVGTVYGGARYGTLTSALSDSATSVPVALIGKGGQMLPGSAQDAAQLATLCWVQGANDTGEYFAYEGAALTSANAYTLSGLVRGAFGTGAQASASGAKFVRVDNAVGTSGPLDLSLIGQTIYFKFTSFNVYSRAEQSLADVDPYTYTVTGAMAKLPPPPFDQFQVLIRPDATREFRFGYTSTPTPIEWMGAQIRYTPGFVSESALVWEEMLPLTAGQTYYTSSPVESRQLMAGDYTFAIRSQDRTLSLSTLRSVQATLPTRRSGEVVATYDEADGGWTGTLSACEIVTQENILESINQDTWADLTTWDAWLHWNSNPTDPISYTTPVRDLGSSINALLDADVSATGTQVLEMRSSVTSNDPVGSPGDWSAWRSLAGSFTGRYFQVRATVTATSTEPVPSITAMQYQVAEL